MLHMLWLSRRVRPLLPLDIHPKDRLCYCLVGAELSLLLGFTSDLPDIVRCKSRNTRRGVCFFWCIKVLHLVSIPVTRVVQSEATSPSSHSFPDSSALDALSLSLYSNIETLRSRLGPATKAKWNYCNPIHIICFGFYVRYTLLSQSPFMTCISTHANLCIVLQLIRCKIWKRSKLSEADTSSIRHEEKFA